MTSKPEAGETVPTYRSAHLLDPELKIFASDNPMIAPLKVFEVPPANAEELQTMRELTASMFALGDPAEFKIDRQEVFVPCEAGPDVRCLLYVPENAAGPMPAYLHLHGGGYIAGSPDMLDQQHLQYARQLGAVICSVDYRMGPENPIPAPLDDSYAALAWLHSSAEELNIDTSRIAIGGESAGGGLAAALAIMARDRGEHAICHQHLSYPMLDNSTGSPDNPGDPLTGEFIWTRAANQYGWRCHLGDAPATAPQVPARLLDFAGLPPAWISTSGLDLFRDENIAYASRLMAAGVPTELTVVPGAPHGFAVIPGTRIGERFNRAHLSALASALNIELAVDVQ